MGSHNDFHVLGRGIELPLSNATVVKNVAYAIEASAIIPEFVSSSHRPDLDCRFDLANAAVSLLTEKIRSCECYALDKQ